MRPIEELEMRPANPVLRELVVEASHALALLDAARLEELALSCQALTQAQTSKDLSERALLALQAREAVADMAVFTRVLEATRANLNVMKRLHELRAGRLEYTERQVHGGAGAASSSAGISKSRGPLVEGAEGGNGDD